MEIIQKKIPKNILITLFLIILSAFFILSTISFSGDLLSNKISEKEQKEFLMLGNTFNKIENIRDAIQKAEGNENLRITTFKNKKKYYMEYSIFTLKTCEKLKSHLDYGKIFFCKKNGKKRTKAYYQLNNLI